MVRTFLIAATLTISTVLHAQDGYLDNSFSGDGYLTYDHNSNEENGMDIVVRPDGKIWAVANSYDGTNDVNNILLMRYNADGTLDNTFYTDGIEEISAGSGYTFGTSLALRPDGHLVIGGYFIDDLNYSHVLFIQVDANGALDPGFGAGGLVIGDNDSYRVTDIGLQSNGTLFFTAARLEEILPGTGHVSPAGELSAIHQYFVCGIHNRWNGLTVTADDRILITGNTGYGDGGSDFIVPILALTPDLTPDISFSPGYVCGEINALTEGIEYYDSGNPDALRNDSGNDIVELANGDILVGGTSVDTAGNADVYRFMLLKVHADNSVDESFGLHGFVKSTVGKVIRRIAVQGDGKIVVAGGGYDNTFLLARFNADGTLDTSFGTTTGHTASDFGGISNFPQGMAVQPDGRILLIGSRSGDNDDLVIARYTDAVTGIAEEQDLPGISVLPNPALGSFTVNLPASSTVLELTDALGHVLRTEVVGGRASIAMNASVAGTYYVLVHGSGGRTTRRVVVL